MENASSRVKQLQNTMAPIHRFCVDSTWAQKDSEEECCDFTFGNPHEQPLNSYVDALSKSLKPQNKDWFAYKQSEAGAQEVVAKSLTERYKHKFEPEDIVMTNGAIAALNLVLNLIIEAGDEVMYMTPHWFLYEGLILEAGGKARKVSLDEDTFELDLLSIEAGIHAKTRAVIINSPHNPSGKIIAEGQLQKLSEILKRKSDLFGHEIYLISDEAYSQILFDDREFISPVTLYENSFLIYTYGKVHLTPGQRIGYIAMPEAMGCREEFREALNTLQMFKGWAFPNALLQHSISDLEKISIDINELQSKRDILIESLTSFGYEVFKPESTFYLLVKSPIESAWDFVEKLAKKKVYCLPGETFGLPGYFRISLTANKSMIEQSLEVFESSL
ncbi:MAG: aminotransferase class I/II-fold pyridoxal phosphate-dependent enzyme [Lentisphaeraceae bacterium]|nr:aminotransferase class I/II-fold pyridoxal phosphate-dependent enzyme [Lentisphaeraceae bacterium]